MSYKIADILRYFTYKYEGNFEKIYRALESREQFNMEELKEYDRVKKYECLTVCDDEYPTVFKLVNKPPFAFFYEGNLELLNKGIPIGAFSLENGARFYSVVDIDVETNRIGTNVDYLLMCEDHNQMDSLLETMKNKGIDFKSYKKSKSKKRDMERLH